MRIALLSDIHGNATALNAVLADIAERGGADSYWIMGDLVALGPEPVLTLEILSALPHARFVRGNTDRYVCTGDRPSPSIEEAKSNPQLLPALVEVANTFAWTQGMVTAGGWLQWLQELPLEMRANLPDGTRFLGVHSSPGQDDGAGISPAGDASEFSESLAEANADFICVGHTHLPFDREIFGIRVVNPGAVSLSLASKKYASYAFLNVSTETQSVEHRKVLYDRDGVIDQLKRIGHPGRGFLIKHLSG
jgi:predicted phosphodiesterase